MTTTSSKSAKPTDILNGAFRTAEKFFDGVAQRDEIEPSLASPRRTEDTSYYGPGFGAAAALLLSGSAQIHVSPDNTLQVVYSSTAKSGGVRSLISAPGPGGSRRWWGQDNLESACASALLGMAEAVVLGSRPDTLEALRGLAALSGFPAKLDSLRTLTTTAPAARGQIHRVSDWTYFELKEALIQAEITVSPSMITPPANMVEVPTRTLRGALGLSAPLMAPGGQTRPLDRLKRLARRGGAALLVGPPGTFKTETVKRLVLETGAQVVKMRGSPGVEDRDFIGAVMPGEGGARWVDGPLATAFTLAKHGPTVLHVDELLCYHHVHLNVLVGAMDELTFQDLEAKLAPPMRLTLAEQAAAAVEAGEAALTASEIEAQVQAALAAEMPDPQGRYYLLDLPNGDALICPKRNLVWAMTTNWGEDTLQTSQEIDARLLSRFHVVVEYTRPEMDVVLPIYESVAGGDVNLARAAYDIEDLTHEQFEDQEGVLVRPLDPRKTIALIQEARAAMEDGLTFRDALLDAALVTVLPHCCARDTRGVLEAKATETLTHLITQALRR